MDVEQLEEDDRQQKETARSFVEDRSDLTDLVTEGGLKGVYASIYGDTRWGGYIAESSPTYYRKDAAYASDYAAKDTQPVIVFLLPSISDEEGFREYTGMGREYFLEQVNERTVIPIRAGADVYRSNEFYETMFDRWDEVADGAHPPLYANALEDAVAFQGKFWKSRAHDLVADDNYPRMLGESVRPDPDLDPRPATRYLAERLEYLDVAGRDIVVDAIELLLDEYQETGEKPYLETAATVAFYAHEIFTAPIFYTMGSTVTFSRADYVESVEFINRVYEERENTPRVVRALARLSIPVSKMLLKRQQDARTLLPSPEEPLSREEFHDLRHRERLADELETATEYERQFEESLTAAQLDGDIADLGDDFTELREIRQNALKTKLEEMTAINDWIETPVNFCAKVTAALPTTPITGVSDLVTSNETWEFVDAVNELIRTGRMKELYEGAETVQLQGQVWEKGSDSVPWTF
ncbi:hypothetical protein [Halobellus ruber]|uniref:Uncharacterized protein n=1 Tax=Halobellus ruber TaxID=2761102 RepID=A0A7J9SG38_9EURY|nr:hypothetical protein [Halobellus ruber]MBB6645910.1 hypothetical protein [Halobellus ruber]